MKHLPVGVYCVSVQMPSTVTFRGETYALTPENTFPSFEALVKVPLVPATEDFCGYGYEGNPIIIVPNGVVPIGETGKVADRFRVVFPRAVTILGDTDSVIQGSYYFGSLNMEGDVDGQFFLDSLTLGCRVADLRTGGENVYLWVTNCKLTAAISGHLITVGKNFPGDRYAILEYSTVDGTPSMNGEGSIFFLGSGCGTMRHCTVKNTSKFFGMSNYLQTATTPFFDYDVIDCRFENCTSLRGFTFLNPCGPVLFQRCVFKNSPTITAKNTDLIIDRCRFDRKAEVIANRPVDLTHTRVKIVEPPKRRTTPDPTIQYPITDPHIPNVAADMTPLDRLYANRQCYHGDFHCHSNSGGTSDGKTPIEQYVADMKKVGSDFAAIVDHRQMRHFFLPCWDEQYLICGTEPGQYLDDPTRPKIATKMDYTMIFPDKHGLMQVMETFQEFRYAGTKEEGCYQYCNLTPARFRELSEFVYGIGGLVSHAHPKQLMVSDDPLDYYFGDHMAIETIHGDPNSMATRMNHKLWTDLLALGCRVKTHGSSDSHGKVVASGMTTVYSPRHHSTDIFQLIRGGDCNAGAVGIRMCIDDAPMGSVTEFAPGKTLYVRVGDTHPRHVKDRTVYTFRLYTDRGLAYVHEYMGEDLEFAFPVEDRKFYRVEIYNESDDHLIALGNPIWLPGCAR